VPIGYYNDPDKTARTFVTIDGKRYSIPIIDAPISPLIYNCPGNYYFYIK